MKGKFKKIKYVSIGAIFLFNAFAAKGYAELRGLPGLPGLPELPGIESPGIEPLGKPKPDSSVKSIEEKQRAMEYKQREMEFKRRWDEIMRKNGR
jgi:hypothetical protein